MKKPGFILIFLILLLQLNAVTARDKWYVQGNFSSAKRLICPTPLIVINHFPEGNDRRN